MEHLAILLNFKGGATALAGGAKEKDGADEFNDGGKFAPPPPMGGVEITEGTKPIKLFPFKLFAWVLEMTPLPKRTFNWCLLHALAIWFAHII